MGDHVLIFDLAGASETRTSNLRSFLQLISSDADGAIQRAGRFRVENGSSDEVREDLCLFIVFSFYGCKY